MSEQKEISFYDFREVYRAFFAHVIEDAIGSGFVPTAPRQTEEYLAQEHLELFLPLLPDPAPKQAFSRFQNHAESCLKSNDHYKYPVFSHLDFSVVEAASRNFIKPTRPGLIGCHYRSIGLDKLRNSAYHGTGVYWKNVKQKSRDFTETAPEKHFSDLLGAYFDLFEKQLTFNQQVFNTNHPPGPIGMIFKRRDEVPQECQNSSTLIVGSILEDEGGIDLVNELKQGLVDDKGRMTILSYLRQESRESKGWEEYSKKLLTQRETLAGLLRNPTLRKAWDKNAGDFFRKRLPRNEVAGDVLGVLTLFQSYLVYGLLAGMCVYTFPTTAQPDLPTCGFTLMTEEPLRNEAIEFVQRVSELVYGELIGNTVVGNYRRFFHANLLESRGGQKPLKLLGDEKANIVLASALAGSPIPIEAVDSFLAFASKLPQVSIYENRRYSFFLVLTHQEFLERFIDRLPYRKLDPGQMRREKRIPEELFYNDEVSLELAGHGMRVNAGERSSPGHVLFFVYPPYDSEIFDTESPPLRKPEHPQNDTQKHTELDERADAIEQREAVILTDIIPTRELVKSGRLQFTYARYFNGYLDAEELDLDKIAEALTFGNSEVLALLYEYEPHEKMKIYHGGAHILESRLRQWELPARSGDRFISELNRCLQDFAGRQERFHPLIQEFSNTLVKLLIECSRRRKGIFLVFHPQDKPDRWGNLDITQQSSSRKFPWEFHEEEFKEKVAQLCTLLQKSSSSDGAIVVSRKDNGFIIYTKISIQLNGLDDTILRKALAMKGVQARSKYPALRSFGTKHNAAYEYAMTNSQGGFAVTVSSDGPVTLFYPQEMTEQEARSLGDPELADWKWRVNIIRM